MIIKLAWRNLWRNRRRTFITMASVFFAVILSSFMRSFQEGTYGVMIDSMVGSFTGYGQVYAKGFWEEKNVDNSFEYTPELKTEIVKTKGIEDVLPRIESFALAATDKETKGAMVVGIDYEKEAKYAKLYERIAAGEYFKKGHTGAILGTGLAEQLKVSIGDTIVLIGQGFHGSTAAGKFEIIGTVKYGSPELSKQLVFLSLSDAQYMYGMENRVTNAILEFNENDTEDVVVELKKNLPSEYEARNWEELVPDLLKMIDADRYGGYVFMIILYMVIAFGIFGTVLMMLMERQHEFGVLVSIGMKRVKLAGMVWFEVMYISLLGTFVGIVSAFPLSLYFYLNPIRFSDEMAGMMEDYGMEAVVKTSIDPMVFIVQAIIVACISIVISFYPFYNLNKLNPIKAMHK